MTFVAPSATSPSSARSGPRTWVRTRSSGVLIVALLVAAALISGFTILREIDPFDEGLTLQAAHRVASGQVPYRDFLWAYGPLQPYLLGLLSKLFGASLLDWRILRVIADAGVAVTAYLLVVDYVGRPAALVVWLAVACEMAEPRSANPFPLALLAVLLALYVTAGDRPLTRRRLAAAAILTAVAAAFRLDFGLYGLLAVTVSLAARRELPAALGYTAAALGLSALVYLPFAVLDGPGHLYHALIGTSLSTGGQWRLPFPIRYHPPPHSGVLESTKHGLDFYVPALLVIGFAVIAAVAVTARRARPPAWLAGALVFGLGALVYLLSRTDEFHAQPLFVVVAVGLVIAAAHAPRPVAVLCALIMAALLVHGVANRLSALVRPPAEATINLPVADGVKAPPREARAIERMVALVDAHVPAGRPIYVLPRRSDLVRIGDPLIYVLTQRPNPTAEDFGLLTGAAAQQRIVRTLARIRPRVIVRWTDPASSQREPNARGRSSGVHALDRWTAVHYRVLEHLYHYDVLIADG